MDSMKLTNDIEDAFETCDSEILLDLFLNALGDVHGRGMTWRTRVEVARKRLASLMTDGLTDDEALQLRFHLDALMDDRGEDG